MDVIIEFVVKDIQKSINFYTKYLNFDLEFTEYDPVSWAQLKNEKATIMLVTYEYAKKDIENFKQYTLSTNLYKFRYENLEVIEGIYDKMKKDDKNIFLPLRKADFRYEFGVYDEDNNMILVTVVSDD